MKIMILGGTGDARELANRLVVLGHDITTSLAGRTRAPSLPCGDIHAEGFGGAEGLAAFLTEGGFEYLIDATHPFAAQISANAVQAARQTGAPLLRLARNEWIEPPGAGWLHASDITEAAHLLPAGAIAFVTSGRKEIAPFLARIDCRLVLRMIEPPETALPEHAELILARPPFRLEAERQLMQSRGITHLVTKNAGGDQTRAKLDAARELGVRVVMVDRPILPEVRNVISVDAAVAAIQDSTL